MIKFLVLFSLVVFTGVAQTSGKLIENLNKLMKQNISWKKISRNDFTPAERNTIGKLINDSSNYFCLDFRIDGDYLDDFHLLDLDGDKDLDVVYEGFECAGASSRTVIVYLNQNNNRFIKALSAPGRLSSLKAQEELVLYQYPCGSETFNTLVLYSIQQDSLVRKAGIHCFFSPLLESMELDPAGIFPKNPKEGKHYKMIKGFPVYAISKVSFDHGLSFKREPIGYTLSETIIQAYGEYRDPSNETWRFVLIDPASLSLSELSCEFPILVWVNNSDLKISN